MPLVLVTDDRAADWAAAARRLPDGGVVVVRARNAKQRRALAEAFGAAGLHLPEARMKEALHWRVRHPDWIITSSAHSLKALMGAKALDAVFLSPVFATASHKDARHLTPVRAAFIAGRAPVPVYALGGITPQNAVLLAPAFSGIAAIGSLL